MQYISYLQRALQVVFISFSKLTNIVQLRLGLIKIIKTNIHQYHHHTMKGLFESPGVFQAIKRKNP